MKKALAVLVALLTIACGPPKSLQTQQGRDSYSADQVVQRLGEFQNAVIDGRQAGKVTLADARAIVSWISGDRNASPSLLGAVDILKTVPQGWRATVQTSWQAIRSRVLAIPDLATWVPIIDGLLDNFLARACLVSPHTVSTGVVYLDSCLVEGL